MKKIESFLALFLAITAYPAVAQPYQDSNESPSPRNRKVFIPPEKPEPPQASPVKKESEAEIEEQHLACRLSLKGTYRYSMQYQNAVSGTIGTNAGFFNAGLGCKQPSWKILDPRLHLVIERSAYSSLGLTRYWREDLLATHLRGTLHQHWRNPHWSNLSFPSYLGIGFNGYSQKAEPLLGGGVSGTLGYFTTEIVAHLFGNRALMLSGSETIQFNSAFSLAGYYQHWLGIPFEFQTVLHEYGARATYQLKDRSVSYDWFVGISQTKFNSTNIWLGLEYASPL